MHCDYPYDKKGRAMTVSGIYYPDDSSEILRQIQAFDLRRGVGGKAQAIIAPHGAWTLSGPEVSSAFRAAAGREIRAVVLLGNTHEACDEGIYLSDSDHLDTPLGSIPVNQELIRDLGSCSTLIEINDIPHLRDSSLETLFPFIKFAFPEASIVPILMSYAWPEPCPAPRARSALLPALSKALWIILEPLVDEILFIVAANLTAYGDPGGAGIQAEECVRLLETQDYRGFIAGMEENKFGVCSGPILAALLTSGLLDGKTAKLVSGRPIKGIREEDGSATYFGGIAFE